MGVPAGAAIITITTVLDGGVVVTVDVKIEQNLGAVVGATLIPGLSNVQLESTISMPYFA